MIRIRPVGIALAILFMLFGPNNWFVASPGSAPASQAAAVSTVLPEASQVGDQPRHSFVDAVETKEGWKVRWASPGQLLLYLIVGGLVLAFYWPFREAAAKRSDEPNRVEDERE